MMADMRRRDGEPWEACARSFLKDAVATLAGEGYALGGRVRAAAAMRPSPPGGGRRRPPGHAPQAASCLPGQQQREPGTQQHGHGNQDCVALRSKDGRAAVEMPNRRQTLTAMLHQPLAHERLAAVPRVVRS
jgi:hypothetical protein